MTSFSQTLEFVVLNPLENPIERAEIQILAQRKLDKLRAKDDFPIGKKLSAEQVKQLIREVAFERAVRQMAGACPL